MKKIITFLILLPSLTLAQLTTINPDTVCYQTGGSIYNVNPTAGLTYNWNVTAPGVITGGQGTNQIQVDWSAAAAGLINNAVTVQAANNIGCLSPLITLNVFIYNVSLLLTPLADMCETAACVNLQGNPNNGVWSGSGVTNNQFCPVTSGPGTFNLTYTYDNAGCSFVSVMQVDVLLQPNLLPIEHN